MCHLNDMRRHQESLKDALELSKGSLEKLCNEITQSMEEIAVREKYLNNEMETLIEELKIVQVCLINTADFKITVLFLWEIYIF